MKIVTTVLLLVAAVLAGLLFVRDLSPRLRGGTDLVNWRALPHIALRDDLGRPTTLDASDGRMRLIFYGFVRCPDVCPATLSVLKQMYEQLPAEQQKKLHIQMVSVDPEFDRPQILHEYLGKFNPDFTGLTGQTEQIDAAAKEMFVGIQRPINHAAHANHTAQGQQGTEHDSQQAAQNTTAQNAYAAALLHGDQVSVINTKNQFVRVYSNEEVTRGILAKDLPVLLRQYGP